jgi:Sulfatase-modifying factor enzyme 1
VLRSTAGVKNFFRNRAWCIVAGFGLPLGCTGDGGAPPAGPDTGVAESSTGVDAYDAPEPFDRGVADESFDVGLVDRVEPQDGLGSGDADSPPADGGASDSGGDASAACPLEMAHIGRFCVDRYEAFVVELGEDGVEMTHSPFVPVDGLEVRAKSAPGMMPQGYVSQVQAARACANAGKRLCTAAEFALACRGDDPVAHYPYSGPTRVAGACNEGKGSPMVRLFGSDSSTWTYADFNDARLNQMADTLARAGSYRACASPYGVYDCVGNLIEWGADAPNAAGHAVSRGGSYADSEINGPGCLYVTSAHEPTYHDYSTGFRCCTDEF